MSKRQPYAGFIQGVAESLTEMPRHVKQLVVMTADAVIITASLYAAYAMRYGSFQPPFESGLWIFGVAPIVMIPVFVWQGIYQEVARFSGPEVIVSIIRGTTISALILAVFAFAMSREYPVPRSVLLMLWVTSTMLTIVSRLLARAWLGAQYVRDHKKEQVIIYGAGIAGQRLVDALRVSQEFEPVLFVDDDFRLHRRRLKGLLIYHADKLGAVASLYDVRRVMVAIPSLPMAQHREIIRRFEDLPLKFMDLQPKTGPTGDWQLVNRLHEVDIEDILGRDPIPPDGNLMCACIKDKTVLVTGAGGSIGRELSHQILDAKPHCLVLFEQSEAALYTVERQVLEILGKEQGIAVRIVSVLGNTQNQMLLETIMRREQVQTVYHAAAYKHVPIVEQNPVESARNNVFGAVSAAKAAVAAGVETFVLVSTDKAVRPTGVMGASKRVAELVVQALAHQQTRTRLCMVRFGNVLGSSGSVVPLFREQIRRGGPVTLTDSQMVRYFMTLAEAVQLVIQAGAMARSGDVFVLDMGEPIRIQTLAEKMIHLSGRMVRDAAHPDGEIEIHEIGLRPGEKMYEELLLCKDCTPTAHPRIRCAREEFIFWPQLKPKLDVLEQAADRGDVSFVCAQLADLVPSYQPSAVQNDKLVSLRRQVAGSGQS